MKNIFYTVLTAILVFTLYAYINPRADFNTDNKDGIKFHRVTWKEALDLAKKENKLIFLDIYATWCGPCKRLKSTTFSNSRVGKYFNSNFINITLDGEKGDGELIAEKYRITGYPSLFFIDADGNVIAKGDGYMDADELLHLGRSAVK